MTHKLAVVTGASGGIGAAIARALSADDFHIVAQYRSNVEAATLLQSTIRASGGSCDLVEADLLSMDDIHRMVDAVKTCAAASNIRVEALVNNAARMLGPSFLEATPESFDEFVAVNTRAPFFLGQLLSREMVSGGSIVNISSASAHIASAGDIVYAMTKSAVESITRNMAEALAPQGIRVNAVMPGFTDNGHSAFADDRAVAYMSSLSMLGGVSRPDAIADAVSFLASNRASRTTGAVLDVTGGMTLHPRPHRHGSVRDLL
ncbi:SDR family oxidoreductase [Microbacterium foliorum]|uniref:3-oxoacyl-[acyl-carrier-protein] reductase FabG n=1 Tax=Microbacterium foliorum TaxID=104336 RepID=A0A0F0KS55_9MICO|nr:SDR family oxidoreductase [Microbacterium foliorum]AXL11412.1 SDR family oxidoreductase [Microbacterium foliorum]KJL23688.1 3-oxoacyl-[acyl-carrier-protein] reductase FabG [Microbacterium foliorum]